MGLRNNSFVLFVLFIFMSETTSDDVVKVSVEHGDVIGKTEQTFWDGQIYYSFRGIPYAEPPVHELKFMPPIEPERWNEPYYALEEKPTCFQFNGKYRNNQPLGMTGSEDCLYLSVFSPSLTAESPVIVFDYNDYFRGSFNGSNTYSPDFFMEEDVVVVYIGHRLGLFGYLTTEDDIIPANNGIRDFILGLKWIQKNIKNFGGDPERVTLMGSLGGASLAEILLYSDAAKDLFSGIIMQSGTALQSNLFYDQTRLKAFELGEQLEIKTNDTIVLLENLQMVNAETLIVKEGHVQDTEILRDFQLSAVPFVPTVEHGRINSIIDDLPENSNIINDVPVLIGINSREGLDPGMNYIMEPRLVRENQDGLFFAFPIRTNFRFEKDSAAYVDAINDINYYYFKLGYFAPENTYEHAVYIGDLLHSYPTDLAASMLSKKLESNVYYYMFDYLGEFNENSLFITTHSRGSSGNWGATLTDELCYLHLCSRIKDKYVTAKKRVSEAQEIKVTRKMVRMWSNFAKSRNPTPAVKDSILKGFIWEPIDKTSDENKYLHITKTLQMKVNPLGDRKRFWDEFLTKYSAMAVDGVVQSSEPEPVVTRDEL